MASAVSALFRIQTVAVKLGLRGGVLGAKHDLQLVAEVRDELFLSTAITLGVIF